MAVKDLDFHECVVELREECLILCESVRHSRRQAMLDTLELPCPGALGDHSDNECCGLNRANFPFEPGLYKKCLGATAKYAHAQSREGEDYFMPTAGLEFGSLGQDNTAGNFFGFDPNGDGIKMLAITWPTKYAYSEVYAPTKEFWDEAQAWTKTALKDAPSELKGGFVTTPYSQLSYFSLQTAMADSSNTATYIALGIACFVLIFFTRNLLIGVFTTLTVFLIMLTVMGVLTMIGWTQGIMESIIISCGIGMACDFAAHLGFAFRQANLRGEASDRASLARIAVRRMGPSLSAAAFSTGTMGLVMNATETLFTIRFGIFIVMLMGFGYLFAMFFLIPLLAVIGPLGKCGEFPLPTALLRKMKQPNSNAIGTGTAHGLGETANASTASVDA